MAEMKLERRTGQTILARGVARSRLINVAGVLFKMA